MAALRKPSRCAVCQHPQVLEINRALIQVPKLSTRDLSLRWGPHYKSLERHRISHLPRALQEVATEAVVQAIAASVPEEATPHERVELLMEKAQSLLEGAERKKDYASAIRAVRELRGCIELLAKLTGEIDSSTTVNIFAGPTWITVQTAIISALEPYPEARLAVLRALPAP